MKKIGDVTSTATQAGEFTNGNVAAGIAPTLLEGAWFNALQREILNVLLKANIKQDPEIDDQLTQAIEKLAGTAFGGKIKQTLGDSTTDVVSQKTVTDELKKTVSIDEVNKKLDKSSVLQTTGVATDKVMSQKVVTDELNNRLKTTGGTLKGQLTVQKDGLAIQINPITKDGACYIQGRDHANKATWFVGLPTDGSSNLYLNNYVTGSQISLHVDGITLSRDTYINGKLELADYSKFDERYISNIRRGSRVQSPDTSEWGPNECPSGCVLTQVVHKGNTEWGVNNWYRPLQIFINGQWKTLAGDL